MRKNLKKTAIWCNSSLCLVLIIIEMIPLFISSVVVILLSPLFAFVSANGYKLHNSTSDNWWKLYKTFLIKYCTEDLPIIVYTNNF